MTGSDLITISGLLDYIYNRFAVTYLMCFIGVIIGYVFKIMYKDLKKLGPASAAKMALQSVLITVILCAVQDYASIKSFNAYMLLCIFMGMWSPLIMNAITNVKLIKLFIVNISKRVKDPVIKAIGDTVTEMNDESDTEDKTKKEEG